MAEYIPVVVQLGTKIVDYFQRKHEQRDAIENIDRRTVGKYISGPLVEMHGALVRVHTVFV
ncbi:MAG: hypothetical protein WBL67_18630 [Nitrososphaeraceae archaeon]